MKLSRNKHFNSLCVNLDNKPELIEKMVLKVFKRIGMIKGIVNDNYSEDDILLCLSVLLDIFENGIIVNEDYRNELISNVSNLEIV